MNIFLMKTVKYLVNWALEIAFYAFDCQKLVTTNLVKLGQNEHHVSVIAYCFFWGKPAIADWHCPLLVLSQHYEKLKARIFLWKVTLCRHLLPLFTHRLESTVNDDSCDSAETHEKAMCGEHQHSLSREWLTGGVVTGVTGHGHIILMI